MQRILILLLIFNANYAFTQNNKIERKGLNIGFGIGSGLLTLNTNDTSQTSFSLTLPNIKLGYMLNNNLSLQLLLPGATYKYNNKDRGFEGIVIAGQYWIKDNLWIIGGGGFTFDAPAFYTVKDIKTADFYTGFPALTFATGYDIYKKGKFALDIHYRSFWGNSNIINNGNRKGFSNMVIVGLSWF
ncbi:MAG: hypothetical protein ACK4K9_05115 [Bacteroidia bacterium]